jgi:hypothetical protein
MGEDDGFPMFIGGLLGMAITIAVFGIYEPDYKQQAIEKGYAEYHNVTGEWQWIEKSEEL